ncbi:hypothetical protein ACFOWE_10810 [Planomonospora corallina]|uniref:Capsular polysaccharide biosynthesis protein n=1 Tax=Planomonospora corallina TaxID=1806052 RepID=A0ABV8I3Q7_9ACTN
MEFWNIVVGLLRRKAVATSLILFPLAAALVVFFLVPARYTASTFMVLTTSSTGELFPQDPNQKGALTNPLLEFNDGLRTTSTILISAMTTPQMLTRLGAPPEGSTELTIDDGRSSEVLLEPGGPFIYIEADATSEAKAETVVRNARERVRAELHKRQVALGAPEATYISAVDVIPPTEAKQSLTNKAQMTGAVFVLAFLALFGVVYARERSRITKALREEATAPAPETRPSDPETRPSGPQERRAGPPLSGPEPVMPALAPEPPAAPSPAAMPFPAAAPEPGEPVVEVVEAEELVEVVEAGEAGEADETSGDASSPEPVRRDGTGRTWHDEARNGGRTHGPVDPEPDDESATAVFPIVVIDDPVESSSRKSG